MLSVELRIALADVSMIDSLLNLLDVSQQIVTSHFYYKNQELSYSSDIKWDQYFSSPATGYLHVGQLFLGKFFKDAMIIISGNKNIVDFIIEFQVKYMTDEDIEVICEEY